MQQTMVPAASLSYDEALSIYQQILKDTDEQDEDALYLLNNLKTRAIRYCTIRARWYLMDRQDRMDNDSDRTSAHDAFIAAVNMMSRFQKAENGWRAVLADDRKKIGDFAGYVTLFLCLDSR